MITLHPSVFITPPGSEAVHWAESLLDLSLIRHREDEFRFSRGALAMAFEAGQIPRLGSLASAFESSGVDPLSLLTIVHDLMRDLTWAEDEIAVDHGSWSIVPSHVVDCAIPSEQEIPLLIEASISDTVPWLLYGAGVAEANGLLSSEKRLVVATTVVDEGASDIPFTLVSSALGWFQHTTADDSPDAHSGVLSALAENCGTTCYRDHAMSLRIHPAFESSTAYVSANLRGLVLRRSAYLIHKGFMQSTRSLRISADPAAPAHLSSRHGGIARRAHLTKKHEAYRLHGWVLENGEVELASAEPKAYVDIPD